MTERAVRMGAYESVVQGTFYFPEKGTKQKLVDTFDLLVQHAREMGANAIVGLRYDASEVVSKGSATEVLCYGTAVVIEPEK